jgi:hypothetical protein
MIVNLKNPPYFTLVHKQSGKKFNTWNCDEISYDDEKFDIIYPDKIPEQKTLI